METIEQLPMTIIGPHFVQKVLPLLGQAKNFIDIIVFDWRLPVGTDDNPVADLLAGLSQAKERGVSVRVLVSNIAVGEGLKKYGFEVRNVHAKKLMHCKLMLLDKKVAVIGSHNYTISAFSQNMEASVAVRFADEDNELNRFFTNLWGY